MYFQIIIILVGDRDSIIVRHKQLYIILSLFLFPIPQVFKNYISGNFQLLLNYMAGFKTSTNIRNIKTKTKITPCITSIMTYKIYFYKSRFLFIPTGKGSYRQVSDSLTTSQAWYMKSLLSCYSSFLPLKAYLSVMHLYLTVCLLHHLINDSNFYNLHQVLLR